MLRISLTCIVIYFHILLIKNKYKKSYTFYNIISVRRVTPVMIFYVLESYILKYIMCKKSYTFNDE